MPHAPNLEALAALHADAFETPRPWSQTELAGLLSSYGVFLVESDGPSMAMGRVIADEAELLTLAVASQARGRGFGRAALRAYEAQAWNRGARTSFLEVAADNQTAISLYHSDCYSESGRRRAYYTRPDGSKIDAIVLTKRLKGA
ncbi:GNAT family N-acetyltransferase [Celeribacter sp.]|uniref:GNAT family N-acetyltransferase n=1 Tax=Celeribacter sp. TaxID=1890673 RepID=UPI003A95BD58